MVKDVDQLLAELRAHGTIDSKGEFTLSLSEARRKLIEYHSSEKARYLLLLLSAGTAAGAQEQRVYQESTICRLQMPGAYIPESDLLNAFGAPQKMSEAAGASDLVFGLQGAFQAGAYQVEVRAQRPHESFLWTLQPKNESSVPINFEGEVGLEILLHFKTGVKGSLQGVLRWLRGYASKSEEARLIDQYCDRSLLPIFYNGERVDRPLFLPSGLTANIGGLSTHKLSLEPDTYLSLNPWKGALALGGGAVQIVIHGVAYCQIESLGLVGTVYHDGLERDLSRERVVRNATYQQLIEALEAVKIELYNTLAAKAQQKPQEFVKAHLPQLVYHFLAGDLSSENRQALWGALINLYKNQQADSPTYPLSSEGLVNLMTAVTRDAEAREQVFLLLLSRCSEGLLQRAPRSGQHLSSTIKLFQAFHPQKTLILGYLLLGLGALHAVEGRNNASERAWFKCLETVWSGNDGRAQELMYGHMAYSPEHILQQSSMALTMYCREQE